MTPIRQADEHDFRSWDGAKLFYRAWLPERPSKRAVVLLHRGHEHSGRWRDAVDQLDLVESNEAFAAQAISVNREMGWDTSKVNVNGGAIALGHPIGASGCRILVSLLHEMVRRDAKKGLATLCIGGGQGVALAVERD